MTLTLNLDAAIDPRIEGERIYLRRLNDGDVSTTYLEWMNALEVNRYLESRFYEHTMESLRAFVATMASDLNNLFVGIFLKDGDRHIGNIKLGPINLWHGHADIGLLIGDRACWGQGYASEAIGILTDFAFEQIGLHRVTAGAYGDNEGSSRAFEKCGFTREGILRSHWLCDGEFQDGVCLGKVNPRDVAA
jgi:RimJ/RimL family protein N-acetyltransferase